MRILVSSFLFALASTVSAIAQAPLEKLGFQPPAEGVFRSCEYPTKCDDNVDCLSQTATARQCGDELNCRRCIHIFTSKTCFTDPGCEQLRAMRRAQCELEVSSKRASCQLALASKTECEKNKTAFVENCVAVKFVEESQARDLEGIFQMPSFGGRPLGVQIEKGDLIATAVGIKDLSELRFYIVAPERGLSTISAWIYYRESLLSKEAIVNVPWVGPPEVRSFGDITILEYGRELTVKDVARAAVVRSLFRMKPVELAQLRVSGSFDFSLFSEKAAEQICGTEQLVDQGLDCNQRVRFVVQ